MGFAEFIRSVDTDLKQLTVVNRREPAPVQEMLEALFEGQPVSVEEASGRRLDDDVVVLDTGSDRPVTTSLSELSEAILFVNADIYTTGVRGLADVDTPEVILELADVRFTASGYPDTSKQKLLLIELSRHIEARAWRRGRGRLRSGFQRLSRLTDERGTKAAYRDLATTGVDVFVYGVPDSLPDDEDGLHVRGHDCEELRRSWFVVYEDPAGDADAALVCVQTEGNDWEGFWTFDAEFVEEIASYVADRYD